MKKFLVLIIKVFTSIACTAAAKSNKLVNIKLNSKNVVVLKGPVTFNSVTAVQAKLLELSNNLPKSAKIYLYLDTPGGSINAGMQLINTARSIPQTVVTITNFAASMGFITAQLLGPRVILPNGIMMSHRAHGQVQGQIPGEINTRVDYITNYVREIERQCARRMKIDYNSYSSLILNEYWASGSKAVRENAADFVGRVTCDSSLTGTYDAFVQTFFGPVKVTYSKCPLISAPLKISFENTVDYELSLKDRLKFRNYIITILTDKVEFLKKSIDSKKEFEIRYIK